MRYVKTLPAVLLLCAVTLSACGDDSGDKSDGCTAPFKSGSQSDSVKVTGTFGKPDPKATFDTPLKVKEKDLQRTVLDEGDGDTTAKGDQVSAVISVYNGTDDKKLISEPATLTAGDKNTIEAFRAGIECVPVGSRVVTTLNSTDAFGAQGNAQLGVKAGDSLVVVTDVIEIKKPVTAKPWTENVPEVDLSGKKPKVTIPKADPPTDVRRKVLVEGDGETVKSGDTVKVNYQGVTWADGKVFDERWNKATTSPGPSEFSTTGVYEGFAAGLVGSKVGSTFVVGMPAKYGAGEQKQEGSPVAGQDLIFVVQVVSISK